MNCVTHHFACDCREAEFEKLKAELETFKQVYNKENELISRLQAENEKLKAMLKGEHPNCNYHASPMFCNKCGWFSTKALLGDSEGKA